MEIKENNEIWLTPIPALAKPVQVVSENAALVISGAIRRANELSTVTTPAQLQEASALLNELGRCRTHLKKVALDLGRPFRDESDRIKAEADKYVLPIVPLETKISGLMYQFKLEEDAQRQRLLEESQEMALEAQQRQAAAEDALSTATSESGFEQAAKAFDDGLAAAELAQETADLVTDATKAKGVKIKRSVALLSYTMAKVPLNFLLLDETKVKKAILDGTVTVTDGWVSFKIIEGFTGTGR